MGCGIGRRRPVTSLQTLVVSSFASGLAVISIASVVILRMQAQQDRLRQRVRRSIGPYQKVKIDNATKAASGVGLAAAAEGLGPALAALFGFDPAVPEHYTLRWWVALCIAFVVSVLSAKMLAGLAGNLVWFAVPVVWVLLSRRYFGWCQRRRRDELFRQFPDALAMIVRSVRVGIPVSDAIRAVGRDVEAPTGPEFARLSHGLAIGMALPEALKAMAERNGLQEYRFFATALSLQSQTGGGLSETLDNLADVIRKRVAVRQKGQALSAEAKMSSLVLASLPPLAGVGLWLMNGAYITLLFVDPLGQKILATAILALMLGITSMNFLIRKSLS
jgi:tight adherence protein B